ncbi:MAG: hypothetical protein ACREFK_03705 [Stellaceae bacterium]
MGEIRDLARQHTEAAIAALVAIMSDPKAPPAARVSAAVAILDRAHGKPGQAVDMTMHSRLFAEMSNAELEAIAAGAGGDMVPLARAGRR